MASQNFEAYTYYLENGYYLENPTYRRVDPPPEFHLYGIRYQLISAANCLYCFSFSAMTSFITGIGFIVHHSRDRFQKKLRASNSEDRSFDDMIMESIRR